MRMMGTRMLIGALRYQHWWKVIPFICWGIGLGYNLRGSKRIQLAGLPGNDTEQWLESSHAATRTSNTTRLENAFGMLSQDPHQQKGFKATTVVEHEDNAKQEESQANATEKHNPEHSGGDPGDGEVESLALNASSSFMSSSPCCDDAKPSTSSPKNPAGTKKSGETSGTEGLSEEEEEFDRMLDRKMEREEAERRRVNEIRQAALREERKLFPKRAAFRAELGKYESTEMAKTLRAQGKKLAALCGHLVNAGEDKAKGILHEYADAYSATSPSPSQPWLVSLQADVYQVKQKVVDYMRDRIQQCDSVSKERQHALDRDSIETEGSEMTYRELLRSWADLQRELLRAIGKMEGEDLTTVKKMVKKHAQELANADGSSSTDLRTSLP
ncbi:unnamed protein product [Amoebophrya sp. A25]|nr:unnamed protein product [Amoebophrya sp. A25]|eukprot:GSA25T00004290001.1